MKKIIFTLISLILIAGCGAKKPLPYNEALDIVKNLESKKFEVSENYFIMNPYPDGNSREAFNFVYPLLNRALTEHINWEKEPKFMKDLSALLKRDLNIDLDYEKIEKNTKFKVTTKPGFIVDPELNWPIMVEKVKTDKNKVEIYTKVLDSGHGVVPHALFFDTTIRVKSGSKLLKEYVIVSTVNPEIEEDKFAGRLFDYFMHMPELMSAGIVKYDISNTSPYEDLREMRKKVLTK
jgi:hypothetical protein